MKKFSLLFLFLFIMTSIIHSQTNKNSKFPDIKFEKTTYDFGTIEYASNGDCEFIFTNTGKTPLIISNCQGSCGCTVPSCPKEPILPGKSGVIKVHYDTKRTGMIMKQVTVESNAISGTQILKISGNVKEQTVNDFFPMEKSDTSIPLERK